MDTRKAAVAERGFAGRRDVRAEELLAAGDIGRCELIRGEVVFMSPAGARHGDVLSAVVHALRMFVVAHRLGLVIAGDTGFVLSRDPDVVRGPDIAFVRASRVPPSGAPVGYWDGAPDLAVEIVSPGDRWSEIQEKVKEYLAAGTSLVWVIDPQTLTAHVYRRDSSVATVAHDGTLSGEGTVPGLSLALREVLQ